MVRAIEESTGINIRLLSARSDGDKRTVPRRDEDQVNCGEDRDGGGLHNGNHRRLRAAPVASVGQWRASYVVSCGPRSSNGAQTVDFSDETQRCRPG